MSPRSAHVTRRYSPAHARSGDRRPTPYNLATSLALLKVPSGALTAVGALILINGQAIPGLTWSFGSQQQILAYALVFGYAQQLLTRLVDQRASELSSGIPSKHAQSDGALRAPSADQ